MPARDAHSAVQLLRMAMADSGYAVNDIQMMAHECRYDDMPSYVRDALRDCTAFGMSVNESLSSAL